MRGAICADRAMAVSSGRCVSRADLVPDQWRTVSRCHSRRDRLMYGASAARPVRALHAPTLPNREYRPAVPAGANSVRQVRRRDERRDRDSRIRCGSRVGDHVDSACCSFALTASARRNRRISADHRAYLTGIERPHAGARRRRLPVKDSRLGAVHRVGRHTPRYRAAGVGASLAENGCAVWRVVTPPGLVRCPP
jgi:hypothetical protein